MVEVPPIEEVVRLWKEGARARATVYADRAKAAATKWLENAKAAEATWEAAIQDAIRRKAFAAGIEAAGADAYRKGIEDKGATRYAPGIEAASDKYARIMREVLEVIRGVELPPRGPRGAPQNYDRVRAIGDALHNWRIARKTGR